MAKSLTNTNFPESYKQDCFLEWYQLGKPSIADYWLRMTLHKGTRPTRETLIKWGKEWFDKAAILDKEIELGIVEETVAAKIEMLDRHASIGKEIQGVALTYLRDNAEELTPQSAVKLLQVGVDMERESVGIPEALEKMQRLDDEDLMKQITAIISDSAVTIEAIEAEIDAGNSSESS